MNSHPDSEPAPSALPPPNRALIRLGGVGGILAGALGLVPLAYSHQDASPAHELLYAIIDLAMFTAILAIWLKHGVRLGVTGATGFLIALATCGALIGPDPHEFGIDFYQLGSAILAIAMALLSLRLVQSGALRWASTIWIASLLIGLFAMASGQNDWTPFIGILFKAGFLAAGAELLRD